MKGINGVARVAGIGTIQFMIRNSLGKEEQITLHNVIYLPQAPKNLISITKWSSDLKDDCGIFSRGIYSIFMWGNDANKKLIHHPPDCKIPLMPANKNNADDFSAFLAEHSTKFTDNICLFAGGPTHMEPEFNKINQDADEALKPKGPAQQPGPKDLKSTHTLVLPNGSTAKWQSTSGTKLFRIISRDSDNTFKVFMYTIRVLGSSIEITVPENEISPLAAPLPDVVPKIITDVDPAEMQRCLTKEELEAIWNNSTDTISPW